MQKTLCMANNFRILKKNKFRFDITIIPLDDAFEMGNSSFIFNCPRNCFTNIKIYKANKRYNSTFYVPMWVRLFGDRNRGFGLQLKLEDGMEHGNTVLSAKDKYGERIATIELEYNPKVPIFIKWNTVDSAVVTPSFQTVETEWTGFYK